MKLRSQKDSSLRRFLLPGLLLLLSVCSVDPRIGRVWIAALLPLLLVFFVFQKAFEKGTPLAGGARRNKQNRIPEAKPLSSRENRPLQPVATDSDQPHSHSEKSAYDSDTGSYSFRDIQRCVCPNCGFVTDTSHRFCSRCDLDLTKPHILPRKSLKRKDDYTW